MRQTTAKMSATRVGSGVKRSTRIPEVRARAAHTSGARAKLSAAGVDGGGPGATAMCVDMTRDPERVGDRRARLSAGEARKATRIGEGRNDNAACGFVQRCEAASGGG